MISEYLTARSVFENASIAGGVESDRIRLRDAHKVCFLVRLGAASGASVEFTVAEHTAAVAGTSQDVVITQPSIAKADAASVQEHTSGVRINAIGGTLIKDDAVLVNDAGLYFVEVDKKDLAEGFDFVSLKILDPTVARDASVVALFQTKQKAAFVEAV